MSDAVWISLILSVAAILIAYAKYQPIPLMYHHRRIMMDGTLQHVREASGPDPGIVMDMVLTNPFPQNRNDE